MRPSIPVYVALMHHGPRPDPIALEEQGWTALSTGGEVARAFYDDVLDDPLVMLLPGGIVLDDRGAALDAMSGPLWSSYGLEDMRLRQLTDDIGVVIYGVVAERNDERYSALVSSTYVRRADGWKLTVHQQTPR